MPNRVQIASGKMSAARRWGTPPMAEAEAELAEARLEAAILKALPGLTEAGRERLANLLRSGDLL